MSDWNAVDGWTQVVATLVALVGLGVTWFFTWRGQRTDAERAEQAAVAAQAGAERAERTSALSIDTLERIADALEALVDGVGDGSVPVGAADSGAASPRIGLPGGPGSAPPRTTGPARVRWQLSHLTGDRYMLRNIGTATAHLVRIRTDPTMPVLDPIEQTVVAPGEHIAFLPHATDATRDRTVTVEWAPTAGGDSADERWRYPLPPR